MYCFRALGVSIFFFQVSHDNSGFNLKVMINNLDKYGILFPSNLLMFDALVLMQKVKNASNGNLRKLSLDACLDYFYVVYKYVGHDAMHDADYCRRVCEQGAKFLGYGSLHQYFNMVSPLHYEVN